MKNRYYTPSLEEFHVGFEYEFKINDQWHEVGYHPIDMAEAERFLNQLYNGEVRVRYLNKKDLIDLGFTITFEEIKSYGTYYRGFIKYGSYAKLEINVSDVKNNDNIYVHLSENHFRGHIHVYLKNKAELKSLMTFMTNKSKNENK